MLATESVQRAVLDSAKEVFDTMILISLEPSVPVDRPSDGLLASITFTGGIEGCLSILCDPPCAQRIAAGMLCAEETPGEAEVIDAMGEVANLIMGGAKTRLLNEVKEIQISIPSVVQGRQLRTHTADGTTRVVVPVTIAAEFPAELSLLYRLHNSQ
jgi:CheY-specific phosphatase CheX